MQDEQQQPKHFFESPASTARNHPSSPGGSSRAHLRGKDMLAVEKRQATDVWVCDASTSTQRHGTSLARDLCDGLSSPEETVLSPISGPGERNRPWPMTRTESHDQRRRRQATLLKPVSAGADSPLISPLHLGQAVRIGAGSTGPSSFCPTPAAERDREVDERAQAALARGLEQSLMLRSEESPRSVVRKPIRSPSPRESPRPSRSNSTSSLAKASPSQNHKQQRPVLVIPSSRVRASPAAAQAQASRASAVKKVLCLSETESDCSPAMAPLSSSYTYSSPLRTPGAASEAGTGKTTAYAAYKDGSLNTPANSPVVHKAVSGSAGRLQADRVDQRGRRTSRGEQTERRSIELMRRNIE